MSIYDEVIDVLLRGRPQSSRQAIAKVVEYLGEVVSKEAARKGQLSKVEAVWEDVKDRSVFEGEMRNLLKEVDRAHVLYVYSRFLNSRAVGPLLIRASLIKAGLKR